MDELYVLLVGIDVIFQGYHFIGKFESFTVLLPNGNAHYRKVWRIELQRFYDYIRLISTSKAH